ncbi:G0/G1 switch protein 2 [Thalassophryne amazonica]|uniref:G0/G1 switch protein 2 n=1 Tax=Thalassophryne amazonica TaxID=390379 RepID=UPI0014715B55|nr:G0/G1 switch protein 2 [Thalassophryne amazonica]
MESISEIIPFILELLNQSPSRGLLKIYTIGTTLAILGICRGLLEAVCMPCEEPNINEDRELEKMMMLKSRTVIVCPDAVDEVEVKDKHVFAASLCRSSTNRLHAS